MEEYLPARILVRYPPDDGGQAFGQGGHVLGQGVVAEGVDVGPAGAGEPAPEEDPGRGRVVEPVDEDDGRALGRPARPPQGRHQAEPVAGQGEGLARQALQEAARGQLIEPAAGDALERFPVRAGGDLVPEEDDGQAGDGQRAGQEQEEKNGH